MNREQTLQKHTTCFEYFIQVQIVSWGKNVVTHLKNYAVKFVIYNFPLVTITDISKDRPKFELK